MFAFEEKASFFYPLLWKTYNSALKRKKKEFQITKVFVDPALKAELTGFYISSQVVFFDPWCARCV